MFAIGERVYFYQEEHLHEGLVQRICKYHYIILEDDLESEDGLTKWRIAPSFLGKSPEDALLAKRAYEENVKAMEAAMQRARNACRVKSNQIVTINSAKHGHYTGYVLKVNRTTVDVFTDQGFRRADKCLVQI